MGIFSSLSRVFADKDTCPDCKGTGYSTISANYKTDRYYDTSSNIKLEIDHQTPTRCHTCGGSGKIKEKVKSP